VTENRRPIPRWVLLVAFLPGLLNLIPILDGYLQQDPPARLFVGFRYAAVDHAQYMAMAQVATEGLSPALANPFVTDEQDGRFVMIYLWAVGQIARTTGLDLVAAWHGVGLLAAWAFFLVVWRLCSLLFASPGSRRLAFLMVCFSTGLDWLVVGAPEPILAAVGVDRDLLNHYYNWSSFGAAHLPMWLAAYALVVGAIILLYRRPSLPRLIAAPLLLLLAFWIHPYTALVGAPTLGLAALLPWASRLWRRQLPEGFGAASSARLAGAALAAVALIGTFALWARQDPVYAATSAKFFSWREYYSLLWYPVFFGIPLVLAAYGLVHLLRATRPSAQQWLLVAWLLTSLLLSNFPLFAGTKFLFTLHLPLALLAALGVERLDQTSERWRRLRARRGAVVGFWLLVGAGALLAPLRGIPQTAQAQVFVSQPQLDLLAALRQLPAGNVAAPPSVAIMVPWKAAKRVYYGHWYLSFGRKARLAALKRLYDPATPLAEKRDFVDAERIRYILEDPWTRGRLGETARALGFREVFANDFGRVFARGEK